MFFNLYDIESVFSKIVFQSIQVVRQSLLFYPLFIITKFLIDKNRKVVEFTVYLTLVFVNCLYLVKTSNV